MSAAHPTLPYMLRLGDEAFAELVALGDAKELCGRLLASPWGWGRSTRHQEAVELLASLGATGELPPAFVALMVCTCRRWDRVTAPLIAAVEQSKLLDDADLDELARTLLSHEHAITFPLAWLSREWLEIELDDSTGRTHTVSDDTLAHHRPCVEPPLRRWAARRALTADAGRLGQLIEDAKLFEPRHRDAIVHGLLDVAHLLDEPKRRSLVSRGLAGGRSGVRLAALELLCELDGPDAARRRAHDDSNATVRKWTPPIEPVQATLI